MKETQKAQLLRYFQAIGQPERLKILGLTANRPHTVPELAQILEIRETEVTHHIKRLQKMELVRQQDETVLFAEQSLAALAAVTAPTAERDRDIETAVLDVYIEDHRIRQFPRDTAAKRVLLNWLANQFTPGRQYSRSRVEYLLRQHTADPSWAQRQLLDANLLHERNHIFQRTPAHEEKDDE